MDKLLLVRRVTQAVSLVFFVFLLFEFGAVSPEIYYRIDPLGSSTAALAARALFWSLAFGTGLVVLTFVMGRVFCGWACPLGALIDATDFFTGIKPRFPALRRLKHHLLIAFLLLAAFGVAAAWWLDPMVWAGRVMAPIPEWKTAVAVFAVFFLLSIILGRRGFCRAFCPLGAMLGWIASISPFEHRVSDACTECGLCVDRCRMRALGPKPSKIAKSECIHCRQCDSQCPEKAIDFVYLRAPVPKRVDPLRRQYLATLGGGVAAGALARFVPDAPAADGVLRPPGSVSEAELAARCIRCGTCVRACPTHTLRNDVGPIRVDLFQLPVLVARDGGCSFECNVCGCVCPTGAIEGMTIEEKRKRVVGLARIDKSRCIVTGDDRPCLNCYAACPLGAISLDKAPGKGKGAIGLAVPKVIEDKCTGCGLCEARCPVAGDAAISVTPKPRA